MKRGELVLQPLFIGQAFHEHKLSFVFFLGHLVLTKIDNYTVLDCSLISPPEITENHLDFNLKVTIAPEHPAGYREYLEDGPCTEGKVHACSSSNFISYSTCRMFTHVSSRG
jgi:hypothetical protein